VLNAAALRRVREPESQQANDDATTALSSIRFIAQRQAMAPTSARV